MVSTHLKNISQNWNLPQIEVKIEQYLKPPPSSDLLNLWLPESRARLVRARRQSLAHKTSTKLSQERHPTVSSEKKTTKYDPHLYVCIPRTWNQSSIPLKTMSLNKFA